MIRLVGLQPVIDRTGSDHRIVDMIDYPLLHRRPLRHCDGLTGSVKGADCNRGATAVALVEGNVVAVRAGNLPAGKPIAVGFEFIAFGRGSVGGSAGKVMIGKHIVGRKRNAAGKRLAARIVGKRVPVFFPERPDGRLITSINNRIKRAFRRLPS